MAIKYFRRKEFDSTVIRGTSTEDYKRGMPTFEQYKTMQRDDFCDLIEPGLRFTSNGHKITADDLTYLRLSFQYEALNLADDLAKLKEIVCALAADPNFKIEVDEQLFDNLQHINWHLLTSGHPLVSDYPRVECDHDFTNVRFSKMANLKYKIPHCPDTDFFTIDYRKFVDALDAKKIIIIDELSDNDFYVEMMNKCYAAVTGY